MPGPKRARSRDHVEFPPQPGPYIANAKGLFTGEERTPILYHAVAYHRGYNERRTWGLFRVADYPDAKAARAAAVACLDARKRNGEIAYYIQDIYIEA